MATYVDVYIPAPTEAGFKPTPDPCVLTLAANGIRFRNFATTAVVVDLTDVPGFKHLPRTEVPASGSWIAVADPAAEEAGVHGYDISVPPSHFKAQSVVTASPRVILDV